MITGTVDVVEGWNDISDSYDATAGSILLTTIYILSTPMHLGAIRVDDEGAAIGGEQVQRDLDNVYGLYDTALVTTEIPGYDGAFVLYATPHGS